MAGRSGQEEGAIRAPGAYLRQAARNVLRDEARAAERHCAHQHVPIEDHSLSSGDPVAALEARDRLVRIEERSEEHTSELQSLMRISYAVFCLKKKKKHKEKTSLPIEITYT